jgi:hypothetical protein
VERIGDVEVLVAEYVCKEPNCTESVSWHLINGEIDCIEDNRAAVMEYAMAAEAQNGPLTVTVTITSEGYIDHHNVIVLESKIAPTKTDTPPMPMEM